MYLWSSCRLSSSRRAPCTLTDIMWIGNLCPFHVFLKCCDFLRFGMLFDAVCYLHFVKTMVYLKSWNLNFWIKLQIICDISVVDQILEHENLAFSSWFFLLLLYCVQRVLVSTVLVSTSTIWCLILRFSEVCKGLWKLCLKHMSYDLWNCWFLSVYQPSVCSSRVWFALETVTRKFVLSGCLVPSFVQCWSLLVAVCLWNNFVLCAFCSATALKFAHQLFQFWICLETALLYSEPNTHQQFSVDWRGLFGTQSSDVLCFPCCAKLWSCKLCVCQFLVHSFVVWTLSDVQRLCLSTWRCIRFCALSCVWYLLLWCFQVHVRISEFRITKTLGTIWFDSELCLQYFLNCWTAKFCLLCLCLVWTVGENHKPLKLCVSTRAVLRQHVWHFHALIGSRQKVVRVKWRFESKGWTWTSRVSTLVLAGLTCKGLKNLHIYYKYLMVGWLACRLWGRFYLLLR